MVVSIKRENSKNMMSWILLYSIGKLWWYHLKAAFFWQEKKESENGVWVDCFFSSQNSRTSFYVIKWNTKLNFTCKLKNSESAHQTLEWMIWLVNNPFSSTFALLVWLCRSLRGNNKAIKVLFFKRHLTFLIQIFIRKNFAL